MKTAKQILAKFRDKEFTLTQGVYPTSTAIVSAYRMGVSDTKKEFKGRALYLVVLKEEHIDDVVRVYADGGQAVDEGRALLRKALPKHQHEKIIVGAKHSAEENMIYYEYIEERAHLSVREIKVEEISRGGRKKRKGDSK